MAWIMAFLVILLLVQVWLVAAFGYALMQTGERMLWLQISAAAVMMLAFGYMSLAIFSGERPNTGLVLAALGIVMLLTTAWRHFSTRTELARIYPRGIQDIMRFRRPATDLKRRVRTK